VLLLFIMEAAAHHTHFVKDAGQRSESIEVNWVKLLCVPLVTERIALSQDKQIVCFLSDCMRRKRDLWIFSWKFPTNWYLY